MRGKTMFIGIIALAIAGYLGWSYYQDASRLDARHLEIANKRAGRSAQCELIEREGAVWGICRTAGNPNAWQQRGERWAAANGPAQQIADRLATMSADERGPAADVYIDRENPPQLPAGLL